MVDSLRVGNVYLINNIFYIRVLAFDSVRVFFEKLDSFTEQWGVSSNLRLKYIFYGMASRKISSPSVKYVRFEKYSDLQLNIIRPDLPIGFARDPSLSWSELIESDDMETLLNSSSINTEEIFHCDEFYLHPEGPKGGFRKGERIVVDAGGITYLELIRKAANIQRQVFPYESKGIGIYRMGLQSKKPTFYIGDYFSRAEVYS